MARPLTACPQGAMSFEDRIRQAVARALDDIRTRMEQEVRALVRDLATDAAEERQLAIKRTVERFDEMTPKDYLYAIVKATSS